MGTGVKKIFVLIFMFLFSAISGFCAENSLAGIDIKYSSQDGYNIILKTDKTAQVTKSFDENKNLILTLKQTLPSQALEIVYDNPEDLTNVIVQKKNKNNTIILFEGKNIANAQIFTKELTTGILKPLNDKNNILFIFDKKNSVLAICALAFLFLISLRRKPEKNLYRTSAAKELNTQLKANTLRKKNLIQSRNIPSINYKVNSKVSVPADFVINSYEEEKIRKVG